MRLFTDRAGNRWDAVLGRESWGAIVLLFVPGGSAGVRQAPMASVSYDSALAELDGMTEAELQRLLDASQPKND